MQSTQLWKKANRWTPSEETVTLAAQLFKLLEERRKEDDLLKKTYLFVTFQKVFKNCTDIESLLQVTNGCGYNLLQTATAYRDIEIIDLLISEGVSPDLGKCSPPLHIASSKGDIDLVLHLLDLGANLNKKCGMCWPKPHLPIKHVPSRFHFLETDIFLCDTNSKLPLMCAIEGDHVAIVDKIWKKSRLSKCYPLHWAAENSSLACLEYFTTKEGINTKDDCQMTPLMYGVSVGKKVVQRLLDFGADVHCHNANGGVLHHFFRNLRNPLELYEVTKLLLGHGLESSVNTLDRDKNTVLHFLVLLCNRKLETLSQDATDQENFNEQVIKTLELLLLHNVDANIFNSSGVTALHKLLLTFDFVLSNEPRGITADSLPQREFYEINMEVLNSALSILCRHEADVCSLTAAGRSSIIIVLQSILEAKWQLVSKNSNELIKLMSTLCKYGTKLDLNRNIHNMIVASLTKLTEKSIHNPNMSDFTISIYETLFKNGLDPNKTGQPPANILAQTIRAISTVRSEAGANFLYKIVEWQLQRGANPDIEPYALDLEFRSSQSCFFLKKTSNGILQLTIDELQSLPNSKVGNYVAEKLLYLICNSVSHPTLYAINKGYLATVESRFRNILIHFIESPRSLKQIARVVIYKQLDRNLYNKVNHLPLPFLLKQYLLFFI
ncbi:DgyrCDS14300 [Dimorphilus gyrociliatus]|uniref:DgyrCDS14300 n=1 Tax=Dimorphilus gyrociliatus TaxID=2664684 RepID=A0A7I8WD84_9ANNE|nr:DgyrCDS14300 [Dimorphilus gyrociliatus]